VPAVPFGRGVCLRVLGPVRLEADGAPLAIGGVRHAKMLAMLALHANELVSKDQLAEAMWDDPPGSWQQQLHNLASKLRTILKPYEADVRLRTEPGGYRLVMPRDAIDWHVFTDQAAQARRLVREESLRPAVAVLEPALALWQGRALNGVDSLALLGAAARMDEKRADVVELLAGLRIRLGDHAEAVTELTDLVARYPLREPSRELLITALHHGGRSAEALTVYEQGRRVLAAELGTDPGRALQELYAAVLRGDPPPAATDEPAPTRSAPNLLPHTTQDFTGREEELKHLAAVTSPQEATTLLISAIDGMGGVGKTALALRLAHRVAEHYPDGQYFVDLRGFTRDKEPLSPAEAVTELLQAAGVPLELIPGGLEPLSAYWRATMANKRALILLDNALDAAQITPLLPGTAGILVVVTSRRRLLSVEGSIPLSLDVLPGDDAVELFRRVASPERAPSDAPELTEIVALCGYLPLAIRIAAARFRHRPSWSLAYLVQQLREYHSRTRLLSADDRDAIAVLKLSYRHLSAVSQEVFRSLSFHPGTDFRVRSVAALNGLTMDETERCLEALVEDNVLLEPQPGVYRLHDLIRDAASTLAAEYDDPAARRESIRRVLDYYLAFAQVWCRPLARAPFRFDIDPQSVHPLVEPPPSGTALTSALDRELRTFAGAIHLAHEQGFPEHVWAIACAVEPLMTMRNFEGRAETIFRDAVAAARQLRDRAAEARSLTGLAVVLRERADKAEAKRVFREAIETSREVGRSDWEVQQLMSLGVAELDSGEGAAAHATFSAALRLAEKQGDRPVVALLNNNLGVVSRDLGRFAEALRYFEGVEAAFESGAPDPEALARLAVNLGLVWSLLGDHHRAVAKFEQALDRAAAVGSRRRQASALAGLSAAYRAMGRAADALEYGRSALALSRELGFREIECDAMSCIGEADLSLGDLPAAVAVLERSVLVAREHQFARYEARAYQGMAHVSLLKHDLDAARSYWETALDRCPPGFYEADEIQAHLDGFDDPTVRCRRCP
jgi:DNA-binding SARP family transcriptional activator/Tfp pilus assembly protein PilF